MAKNITLVVLAILLVFIGFLLYREKTEAPTIVVEDPKTSIPEVPVSNPQSNLIKVTSPLPNSKVANVFTVKGEARGYWYFEASFPVELVDANGKVLWQGPAQAKSDWMTENFVPFEVQISFIKPIDVKLGKLILHKDNPSGLPENDASIEIPVSF